MMEPKDVLAEVVAWEAQLEALYGRIAHLTGQNQEPSTSGSGWSYSRVLVQQQWRNPATDIRPLLKRQGLGICLTTLTGESEEV